MTAEPPEVRIATPDDAPALARLRALWMPGAPEDPGFTAQLAGWLEAEGERRTSWLAEHGAIAVGMASLFEYRRMPRPDRPPSRWGYLSNMFVSAEHRGQGIGSALLAAILEAGDRRGYARIVLSPSPESLAFYARAGFVDADARAAGDRLLVRPGRPL